jgi:GT2 family glycosyltransferase
MTAPRVSVVIPTFQRRESLLRALSALATQTLAPQEYEVVVVVDGSADGSREAAESLSPPHALHVLWQENRGRAAACNAGVAAARGEVVVLLDDDMQGTPDLLTAHLNAHARDSRLAVIGAAPVPITPDLAPPAAYIGRKFNRHLERLATLDGPLGLRDFYSGNLSIRRDVLNEVGGFDEAFTVYGNEDLELSIRLRAAGVQIVYSAEAVAFQSYDKNFAGLAGDNVAKGRTAVLLSRKHPSALPELKIGAYHREPLVRRSSVALLLGMTRILPGARERVTRVVGWLGDRRVPGVERLYPTVLDYCYWCGARDAAGGGT